MKFINEYTKESFDNAEACEKSEKEFLDKKEQETKAEEAKVKELSIQKKELAKSIEDADKELDIAYKEYNEAKESAKAIYKEAVDKANAILDSAREKISVAEKNKYNAISQFNSKFGTYKTFYTGEKAEKEYDKISRRISAIFNSFPFWF